MMRDMLKWMGNFLEITDRTLFDYLDSRYQNTIREIDND